MASAILRSTEMAALLKKSALLRMVQKLPVG